MLWKIIPVGLTGKWQLPSPQLHAEDLSWDSGQTVVPLPRPKPLLSTEELSEVVSEESPSLPHRPMM